VRYLGKEWKRTPTGFLVRTPAAYTSSVLALMRLEHAKGAPTPFLTPAPLDETPLDEAGHSLYRTVVGKMMWMMNERGDLAFPVKELARTVQAPTVGDMLRLRRAVKYLITTQGYVQVLTWDAQQPEGVLRVHVDARWASFPDRRSTSGGVMRLEAFELYHWARMQPVILVRGGTHLS